MLRLKGLPPNPGSRGAGGSILRRPALWFAVFGVGAGLAAFLFLVRPVLLGRHHPPAAVSLEAKTSLSRAREAGASRFAPDLLAAAESANLAALRESHRMEDRFVSFRDFRIAVVLFGSARDLADSAYAAASRTDRERRDRTAAVLTEARLVLDQAEECRPAASRAAKRRLAHAQALAAEAESRVKQDEQERAAGLAHAAIDEASRVCEDAASLAGRFVNEESVRSWRAWIAATVEESRRTGGRAVLVVKERNELTVYAAGKPVKTYPVDLGANRLQRKLMMGDRATPEGRYRITRKKGGGDTVYHRALLLDYPNQGDRDRLAAAIHDGRVPKSAKLGGLIEIHGEGGRGSDWTLGCIALENVDMDDLFARVAVGTPVTIVGGTGENGRFSELARKLEEKGR